MTLRDNNLYQQALAEAIDLFRSLEGLQGQLERAARMVTQRCLISGKILICGNGGSACEAQHLAGELIGRYKADRKSFPAVALSADATVLTCIGNDFSFEDVFARQLSALAQPDDLLIAFSSSGNSPNILRALEAARDRKAGSIAFLGKSGGEARNRADCAIVVPHSDTARIQEAHQFLIHCLMDRVEADWAAERVSG